MSGHARIVREAINEAADCVISEFSTSQSSEDAINNERAARLAALDALVAERDEALAALSGRTVSCSNCNAEAARVARTDA